MTLIFTLLARWGVAEKLVRPLGYIAAGLLLLALCGALWAYFSAREKADDRHNQDIGRTEQRADQAEATIEQTEKANAAADDIKRNADARDAECVRHARNPADC